MSKECIELVDIIRERISKEVFKHKPCSACEYKYEKCLCEECLKDENSCESCEYIGECSGECVDCKKCFCKDCDKKEEDCKCRVDECPKRYSDENEDKTVIRQSFDLMSIKGIIDEYEISDNFLMKFRELDDDKKKEIMSLLDCKENENYDHDLVIASMAELLGYTSIREINKIAPNGCSDALYNYTNNLMDGNKLLKGILKVVLGGFGVGASIIEEIAVFVILDNIDGSKLHILALLGLFMLIGSVWSMISGLADLAKELRNNIGL